MIEDRTILWGWDICLQESLEVWHGVVSRGVHFRHNQHLEASVPQGGVDSGGVVCNLTDAAPKHMPRNICHQRISEKLLRKSNVIFHKNARRYCPRKSCLIAALGNLCICIVPR